MDGTVSLGPMELNGPYIHRRDDEPRYMLGEPEAQLNGGLAGHHPAGQQPVVRIRAVQPGHRQPAGARRAAGRSAGVTRYESISGGIGHLMRRNLKVTGEVTYDLEQEMTRLTLEIVTAF